MPDLAHWERLGRMLQVQRVMSDPRYRNRSLFSRERGINYRLCQDIETSARQDYGDATKIHIELAYGWKPGSIDAVLAGGEPALMALTPAERSDVEDFGNLVRTLRAERAAAEEDSRRESSG